MACCAVCQVLRRIQSGHHVLGQRGGQIALRHGQARIEFRGLLEVSDRLFIPGALVSIHSLVQLVAGFKLVAPAHGNHHAGQGNRERRNTCGSIHVRILLLQVVPIDCAPGISCGWPRAGGTETRMKKLYSCFPPGLPPGRGWQPWDRPGLRHSAPPPSVSASLNSVRHWADAFADPPMAGIRSPQRPPAQGKPPPMQQATGRP
jgi:hypothetical protein